MIPQPGNIIICFFRNGIKLDGTVISWSDQKSVLKSLVGSSTIVIQKTLDDIIYYKFNDAKNEYEILKDKPHKNEDDIKAIAQLKIELNDLERSEIKEKLTTHNIGDIKQTNYGIPNIKVPISQQHPGAQSSRENSGIATELQNLFAKKH